MLCVDLPCSVFKDFKRSVTAVSPSCWLFVVVSVLNYMHLGFTSAPDCPATPLRLDVSEAQASALDYLKDRIAVWR